MFMLLIILSWSLVMLASLALAGYAALGLTSSLWLTQADITNQTFLYKLFNWLSSSPFSLPFFSLKEGTNGNLVNPWVPTPGGLVSLQNGSGAADGLVQWKMWLIFGIMIAVSIYLFAIAIAEFVRLRKKQKISKPYIKSALVIFAVVGMLYGQAIVLIASGIFLLSWFILEATMFDSEALNNYAEERSLISLYHEEKKFEKEVNREGKLTGNVEQKSQKYLEETKKAQEQNEKAKTNDSSALPNDNKSMQTSKAKREKAYFKWKLYKDQLEKFRAEIESLDSSESSSKKERFISKFNNRAANLNMLAKKLNLPESYLIDYLNHEIDFEKSSRVSSEDLQIAFIEKENESSSEIIQYEPNASEDEKQEVSLNEILNKSSSLNNAEQKYGRNKTKITSSGVDKKLEEDEIKDLVTKSFEKQSQMFDLNDILDKNEDSKLEESEEAQAIQSVSNEQIEEINQNNDENLWGLTEIQDVKTNKIKDVYKDFNFKQPDLIFTLAEKSLNKEKKRLNSISKTPFVMQSNQLNDLNYQEEDKKEFASDKLRELNNVKLETVGKPDEVPNTASNNNILERQEDLDDMNNLLQARKAYAINMDIDELNTTENDLVSSEKDVYNDLSLNNETILGNLQKDVDHSSAYDLSKVTKEFENLNQMEHNLNQEIKNLQEIVINQGNLLVKDLEKKTSEISSINNMKFTELEKRMKRLESTLPTLSNNEGMESIKSEVSRIVNKLESISKTVNVLESTSSNSMLSTLLKKHQYNRK